MPHPEIGAELIAAERLLTRTRYSSAHDDAHDDGSLNYAAQAYCQAALEPDLWPADVAPAPPTWPWAAEQFRPSLDPVEDLIKAGALIAAEIDRLLRAR